MAIFVKRLDQIRKRDHKYIGNKTANIVALLREELSTPPGFSVGSQAYREFLGNSGLAKQLARLAGEAATGSMPELEQASRKIHRIILSQNVPAHITEEIKDAYMKLAEKCGEPEPWVAVRSSATMEDTPTASFAGQYETFLYVRGADQVVSNTVKCWASLWSSLAINYREMNGFDHQDTAMGVLVQQMVPSEKSGVLFTADPLSDDRSVIVINTGLGLGEGIVTGGVAQDAFVVKKKGFRIIEKTISDKSRMVTRGKRGGTRFAQTTETLRHAPCLSDPQIKELAKLGMLLEEHFDAPQDVEWGFYEGRFHIFQSRPITTLESTAGSRPKKFTVRWESESDSRELWMWAQRVQPKPISPLAQSVDFLYRKKGAEEAMETLAMPVIFDQRIFNGYLYLRMAPVKGSKAKLEERNRRNQTQIRKYANAWEKKFLPEILKNIRYMKKFDLPAASMKELLAHMDEMLSIHQRHWAIHFLAAFPMVDVVENYMEAFAKLTGIKDPMQAYKTLQGFDNKSVEANRELWLLAKEARKSSAVKKCFKECPIGEILPELEKIGSGKRFLEQLDNYMDSYGDRITVGMDFLEPSLKEDPDYFLPLLKGYIDKPSLNLSAMEKKSGQERDKAVAHAYEKIGPSEAGRKKFARTLEKAQKFIPFLEDHTFFIDQMDMANMRYLFLELGDRLCSAGVISKREDIFFLDVKEVRSAARKPSGSSLRKVVINRKRRMDRQLKMSPPPWVGTPPPGEEGPPPGASGSWYYDGDPLPSSNVLKGLAGSPGTVKGRARIVRSTEDFSKLQPGDIMVCPSTLPPWTPLFSIIGGLVTNTGAVLQHDAIIAREYGIPAVVGTKVGTSVISDGQMVSVDGTAGSVRLY